MSAPNGKILVIRGGAIGDFILTLPVFQALRQHFPQAHLEVLGYHQIVQLATAGGLVDRAAPIDARPMAGFFARNGQLSEDLSDYFSEFDLIISYLYDPDSIFRTNVACCSRAQFIQGPHRPDSAGDVHATRVLLKPLERLAIFEPELTPRLRLSAVAGARSELALHPGSGSERKNWPEQSWASFLERLVAETNYHFLLIGGEAEGERLQRLAAALPPARLRVAQNLPLARLASLLQTCRAFVGHDSGITHLAAALGLPGIALWGESSEQVWRPQSRRFHVVRSPGGLSDLTVQAVLEALLKIEHSPGEST